VNPCVSTRSCQIPVALRPHDSSNSISLRKASLRPEDCLPTCPGGPFASKKPLVTEVAGFDPLAGFKSSDSVVTKVAGFEVTLSGRF